MKQGNPLVFSGAKVALLCGDYIVAYQRDRKPGIPFPGLWDLPGGGREGDESPIECALREFEEEFSVVLSPQKMTWVKCYPSGTVAGRPSFFLAGRIDEAEIKTIRFGTEGERWQLMHVDDFLSRKDAIPHLQIRLAEYLKHVNASGDRIRALAAPSIRVSALFRDRLQADFGDFRPTHVVSLLDPSIAPERMPKLPPDASALQLQFFDGDNPAERPPNETMVAEIVSFLGEWLERHRRNDEARLLIHCHMGASRSTAVAFVALAMFFGRGLEHDAFAHGLAILNKPWPNLNLIRLADQHLARNGALLNQLLGYRAQYPRRREAYRRLNRIRGGG